MLEVTIRIIMLLIILVIGDSLFIKKMPSKPYIKDGLTSGLVLAVGFTASGVNVFDFKLSELIVMYVSIILLLTLIFGLFRGFRREGLIGGFIMGGVFIVLSLILTKTINFLLDLIFYLI